MRATLHITRSYQTLPHFLKTIIWYVIFGMLFCELQKDWMILLVKLVHIVTFVHLTFISISRRTDDECNLGHNNEYKSIFFFSILYKSL